MSNYKQQAVTLKTYLSQMKEDVPGVFDGFNTIAKTAMAPGVLEPKTKELIALALAVAARCEGCIGAHVNTLIRLGVTRQEISETMAVAVQMGGGPSLTFAGHVLEAYDELSR